MHRGASNVQTVAHKKESLIRLLSGFLNLSCFGGFFWQTVRKKDLHFKLKRMICIKDAPFTELCFEMYHTDKETPVGWKLWRV